MKLQILSDLHLLKTGKHPKPVQTGDIVILAGDIGIGRQGLNWAKSTFTCPVLYLCGNNEYYGGSLETLDKELKQHANGSNIRVLQNEELVINNIRFIATTLWTDPTAISNQTPEDFKRVPRGSRLQTSHSDIRKLHVKARRFLESALRKPFDGRTVVITHHAPSLKSVAPRYKKHPKVPYFASALDELVATSRAELWVHGHLHDSVDYTIGSTRVIANPKGYVGEESERESRHFEWDFSVCIQ